MFPIIDGHLDLAYSALHHDRDLTLPLETLRTRERENPSADGTVTVCLPPMRDARIAACIATLYTRSRDPDNPRQAASRSQGDFASPLQAHADAAGQLAYYHALAGAGQTRLIRSREDLTELWNDHTTIHLPGAPQPPLGLIVMMEGADAIVEPRQLHAWHARGVRIVSLVHGGTNQYAVGTGEEGPLTPLGRELLAEMHAAGVTLDLSHLCEASFFEAVERFEGRIIATHTNCRRFVPGNRHFTDEQIRLIVERGGVIGVVVYNRFISPSWQTGVTPRSAVTLDALADHIDHICQLAGSARHAAIGSDLDGGFGQEACPQHLDSIADLPRLATTLSARGYNDHDIALILAENWHAFLSETLPSDH